MGAITNYTDQLTCNSWNNRLKRPHHSYDYTDYYNDTSSSIALKFVVHFIGDLVQPLHLCARGWHII